MSTPHIEHFVDERGNFIYRAEFEGSFLSKDEAKELGKYVSGVLDENAKLRELVGTLRGYLAGDTGPCDCCAMQGTCENHPAPPPCKYELDGEHAPVLGWIDDNLNELGVDV